MGLFGKHKEAEVKDELPPLKFPELPPEKEEKTEISQKEEQTIKQAVAPSRPAPELPQHSAALAVPIQEEEKPLFVKIEKYKEVMSTISDIKTKLKDAGEILAELNKIKEHEDKEISAWHNDLEAIKGKLLSIDKALFEL